MPEPRSETPPPVDGPVIVPHLEMKGELAKRLWDVTDRLEELVRALQTELEESSSA